MKRNKRDWLLTCLRDVEYNIILRKTENYPVEDLIEMKKKILQKLKEEGVNLKE